MSIQRKAVLKDLCKSMYQLEETETVAVKSKVELIHKEQVVNAVGDGGEEEGVLALHNPPRPHDQARTIPFEKKDNQPW